jgi:hypothetical protein
MEKEIWNYSCGLSTAQGAQCRHGLGQLNQPSPSAFGGPQRPRHGQSVDGARSVTVSGAGQHTRCGAALHSLPVLETRNQRRENGLGGSTNVPLHRNLLMLAGKGVLIGVGFGPVETQ